MTIPPHQPPCRYLLATLGLAVALVLGGPSWPTVSGAESPPGQLKAAKGKTQEDQEPKKVQSRGRMPAETESKGEVQTEKKETTSPRVKKAKKSAPGSFGAQTIRSHDAPE